MMNSLQLEGLSRTIDPIGPGEPGFRQQSNVSGNDGAAGAGASFGEMLEKAIDTTNEMQVQSDQAIKELVAGKAKNVHETMLTIERADVALKLMMQVRNKVLDAYREVMRMQV